MKGAWLLGAVLLSGVGGAGCAMPGFDGAQAPDPRAAPTEIPRGPPPPGLNDNGLEEVGDLYLGMDVPRCVALVDLASREDRTCEWAGTLLQETSELEGVCDVEPMLPRLREAYVIYEGCASPLPPEIEVDAFERDRQWRGIGY